MKENRKLINDNLTLGKITKAMYTLDEYFAAAMRLAGAIAEHQDINSFGMIDVKTSANPDLSGVVLLNYKPECAFKSSSEWNIYERVSRGLIIAHGEVIGFPFPKFFNFGDEIKSLDFNHIRNITEKEDGSLGIVFKHHGKDFVTTHGSLDSDQGKWATEHFRKTRSLEVFPGSTGERTTLLTEIIYPENRIVKDYGDFEGFKDLCIYRHNQHALTISEETLGTHAQFTSLNELLDFCATADYNTEGVVVQLKCGARVKFKTDEYLAVHRIRFAISEKNVHKIMCDSPETLETWKATLPNEFFDEVDKIQEEVNKVTILAFYYVSELITDFTSTVSGEEEYSVVKSKLAKFVTAKELTKPFRSLCFCLYDHGYETLMETARKSYFTLKEEEYVRTRI